MSFTNPVLQATTGCNELITSVVVADALHTSDCRLAEEKKKMSRKKRLTLRKEGHLRARSNSTSKKKTFELT